MNEMKSGRCNAMKKIRCYTYICFTKESFKSSRILRPLECRKFQWTVNYVINLYEKLGIYSFVVGLVLAVFRLATK